MLPLKKSNQHLNKLWPGNLFRKWKMDYNLMLEIKVVIYQEDRNRESLWLGLLLRSLKFYY